MQRDISAGQGSTSADATSASQGAVPGLWPAAIIAILCAVVSWTWLATGLTTATAPSSNDDVAASELAQVNDQDIDGALTTLVGDAAFMAQFKKRADGCQRPLAWVSLARGSAQAPARIRLQSGSYYSPVFTVTDAPVRVAIPYPALYEAGRGALTAFDVGGSAIVALLPAWRVSGQNAGITHQVLWHPNKRCQ
jgi:hypothetical protein